MNKDFWFWMSCMLAVAVAVVAVVTVFYNHGEAMWFWLDVGSVISTAIFLALAGDKNLGGTQKAMVGWVFGNTLVIFGWGFILLLFMGAHIIAAH